MQQLVCSIVRSALASILFLGITSNPTVWNTGPWSNTPITRAWFLPCREGRYTSWRFSHLRKLEADIWKANGLIILFHVLLVVPGTTVNRRLPDSHPSLPLNSPAPSMPFLLLFVPITQVSKWAQGLEPLGWPPNFYESFPASSLAWGQWWEPRGWERKRNRF